MDEYKKNRNITSKLTLPLFMLTRQKLKQYSGDILKNHLKKNAEQYKITCPQQNKKNASSVFETFGRVTKVYPNVPCVRSVTIPKKGVTSHSHTANFYNITNEPFSSRKGAQGAHWNIDNDKKLPVHLKRSSTPIVTRPVKEKSKKNVKPAVQMKIYTSPRAMKSSNRLMIMNEPDLSLPGPGYYEVTSEDRFKNIMEFKTDYTTNPYKFYRRSVVPEAERFIEKKSKSFTPGPGHYDTRYVCTCEKRYGRKYEPNIDVMIMQQNILKFRRIPVKKIDRNNYYNYDLQNVRGHGHRHLFKIPAKKIPTKKDTAEFKKKRKRHTTSSTVKSHTNAQYLRMITNPRRTHNYLATPTAVVEKDIRFNCIIKPKHRTHIEKSLPFISNQPRFDSREQPKQKCLTAAELKAIQRLPPDRKLTNHPVMRRKVSEIKSSLFQRPVTSETTDPRQDANRLQFLPVPKILVSAADFLPDPMDDGFYFVQRKIDDFFKDADTKIN